MNRAERNVDEAEDYFFANRDSMDGHERMQWVLLKARLRLEVLRLRYREPKMKGKL